MPTSITLTGFKEFQSKLANMPKILEKEIDGEVRYVAEYWVDLSKNAAPFDNGFLAGGIDAKKVDSMYYEVTSAASYSAYMEWGTKGKVNVPGDLSSYASQFKGKGSGDYYDFLNAILDWVKRKGIGMDSLAETNAVRKRFHQDRVTKKDRLLAVAERIAWSIIKNGVNPHPFFFIQVPLVQRELYPRIDNILKTEH